MNRSSFTFFYGQPEKLAHLPEGCRAGHLSSALTLPEGCRAGHHTKSDTPPAPNTRE
ncbi:MAG: hypothetical protein ACPGWR_16210 [Ardenticatenaceae bacterium]